MPQPGAAGTVAPFLEKAEMSIAKKFERLLEHIQLPWDQHGIRLRWDHGRPPHAHVLRMWYNPDMKPAPRFSTTGPKSRPCCLLSLLAVSFFVAAAGCSGKDCADGLVCAPDITYGSGYVAGEDGSARTLTPLLMDVIEPEDDGSVIRPAVILVHGGSFESGSKEDENHRAMAQKLAAAGYVCFLINYRLIGDNPPAPESYADVMSRAVHAAVVDVKTALRHVHAHAGEYRIDTARIALLGDSAGAIAVLAGGLSHNDRFMNDGPEYPVPPENNPNVDARAAAIVNLWGSGDFFPELFTPGSPPIMTVHGGKDFTVGVSLMPALNIDRWCKENGITHVFYPLPDAGHGAWDADIEGKTLSEAVTDFLNTYVNPPGKMLMALHLGGLPVTGLCQWLQKITRPATPAL